MKINDKTSEKGSVLLVSIIAAGVIATGIASYMGLVNSQNTAVKREQQWNSAMPVTESGIEEALTHLRLTIDLGNYATNGWSLLNNAFTLTRQLSPDAYYVAGISNVNPPVVYSTGFVRIPGKTNYFRGRTVVVTTQRLGSSQGVVAKGKITFKGTCSMDSFDSDDNNYSTGGHYDSNKSRDKAFVGSTDDDINLDNDNKVHGKAKTGPDSNVHGGAVGDDDYLNSHTSGVSSNAIANDLNIKIDDVDLPFPLSSNINIANYGKTYQGTNYTLFLTNGNFQLATLNLSGNDAVYIDGPVTLLITNGFSMTNNSRIHITTNGSLKIYVKAGNTSMCGDGVYNCSDDALKFHYYGMPDNSSCTIRCKTKITGLIYAPGADLDLHVDDDDNNDHDYTGSVTAKTVSVKGKFKFHYDEKIAHSGPSAGFVITSWHEI